MGHWVYEFSGCPDTGDYRQTAIDDEPGHVVLRARPGGLGVVDGFVRESVDELMLVARLRWVASGDSPAAASALLQASFRRRPAGLTGSDPEADVAEGCPRLS
jgi:hypothetical protein